MIASNIAVRDQQGSSAVLVVRGRFDFQNHREFREKVDEMVGDHVKMCVNGIRRRGASERTPLG